MKTAAAIIIPAYNEGAWIMQTLQTLRVQADLSSCEIIVVDDGSEDNTAELAAKWADGVIRLKKNRGKGSALWQGVQAVPHERILFVDADLGATAVHVVRLLDELEEDACEMAVACPSSAHRGGFGLARRLAQREIYKATGTTLCAPLSGQRALTRRAACAVQSWDCGFGIEAAMTLDILKAGLPMREVSMPIMHREHGRTVSGFWHRGKQYAVIRRTMAERQRHR